MMKYFLIALGAVVFTVSLARANPIIEEEQTFMPDRWSKGLHLLVGGGTNTGVYVSDSNRLDVGVGPVLKTEVGYFFNDRWAAEWNSIVKFNFVDGYTVWDSLFTFGARYRFDSMSGMTGPFLRAFFGTTVNVLYFHSSPPPRYANFSRLQSEGPAVGFGWGSMEQTSKGLNWYWEALVTGEWLEVSEAINLDKDVPVSERSYLDDHAALYTLYVTIGVVAF
ncbi:MAG: hypothetical protein ACKOX6_02540 [Bdellovibrio sp.]